MREALERHGYFIARGLDAAMSTSYVRGIYAFGERLHGLPLSTKRRCAEAGIYCGPDAGTRELSYDGGSTSSARSWEFSRNAFTLATTTTTKKTTTSCYPPGYVETFEELYARQDVVGRALARGFSEMLDLGDADYLSKLAEPGDFGTIRLMFYPGTEDADADVGIAPHTDFEAFTVMHQTSAGLQFFESGRWLDAPVADDGFLVIIGDSLERLTNGTLKATPHRVLRNSNGDRFSIIRFHAFAPDTIITPLPQFGDPLYSPVSMENHMRTTMRNLADGIPSWDPNTNSSLSATRSY
mmetsp:Transcript_1145/g.3907  ORF Transcript_1145/g.3907 Transcript_1145/m.3907 type:complete len:297 (+) Transcript_1145:131-1021(+)